MAKATSKKKAAAKKVLDNLPEDVYEVEDVIGHRRYRGRVEYKIRWKGFSDKDDTWEPHENLSDAMELVVQFTNRQKQKQQREEDATKVARSPPGHKKSERKATRASKSEQSPLIKRGGRTVFSSTRHPNTQVRFQLSPSKSFISNAPNELRIDGKSDKSPVSVSTPTIALPAEEVNDVMVMPSASSGLPVAALTSSPYPTTATTILRPKTVLREPTANFDDEEEDCEDWTCSKCKFSCVCSAGRPCEIKTPTLFAAAHSSPSSSTSNSIHSADGMIHDLVSEEEDDYEEIEWTCAKCKCTNKGEDCACVHCKAIMPYEMKTWEGLPRMAIRLAVAAKANAVADANTVEAERIVDGIRIAVAPKAVTEAEYRIAEEIRLAEEAEGNAAEEEVARIAEEMRPRVSLLNEVATPPPKKQVVRGKYVTMEDTTPRFKHQQAGYKRVPVPIFSSNSEVATPHSKKKEQPPKLKQGGRIVLGPIPPPNHMSLKMLFTPIKRRQSMAVTPKTSNASKNKNLRNKCSPPILVAVPADTDRE